MRNIRNLGIVPATLAVALFTEPSRCDAADPAGPPNVLLLFVDNVGYGDLGCYGNRAVRTPSIDRLAAEGVRCTDFYTAAPSCTPSRGAILTGRHPVRNGLNHQLSAAENARGVGLRQSEKILPQYLKPLGYECGAFGKWNIGFAPGSRPTERGFDEFLGHMSGNIHYYKYIYNGWNDLRLGTEPLDRKGVYSTDLFADAAIAFMRKHAARPFFVYLAFNAAHFVSEQNVEPGEAVRWQVPAEILARYGWPPDEADPRRRFLAVLTALDDAIGRVLGCVDDLGLRQRTIVLLISDNGAFMLPGRGLEVQSNAPYRDGGVTTYEGGLRVPALVRWPGRIPPGTICREMLSTLDVLPMVLAAAGGEPPRDRVLDGRDPTGTLAGEAPSPHEALYWVWDQAPRNRWMGLRRGSDKLVRPADDQPWQLFDLGVDPGETHDLARRLPGRVERLAGEFRDWHDRTRREGSADP
jgi:arylsulfatase A-like enzyme